MATYTFLDLAIDILEKAEKPLTYHEIWQRGEESGLTKKIDSTGKTPWQTLGARLYVDVRDNDSSKIVKVGNRPARFYLKGRNVPLGTIEKIEIAEVQQKEPKTTYSELELHPLLTYFAYTNPTFNRGRSILTKTIFHQKSKKSGYSEWTHPDIVGFHIPLEDWDPDIIAFNRLSDNNLLRMFSFEMKKSLNRANYRESYFQAVSNSSWAHEGYLVAVDISKDDAFRSELERLASSFGVGIIHLDPTDIDSSRILYPARTRDSLDWETMNKLCEQNSDFSTFVKDVKNALTNATIYPSVFDEVKKDIDEYIRKTLKITPST